MQQNANQIFQGMKIPSFKEALLCNKCMECANFKCGCNCHSHKSQRDITPKKIEYRYNECQNSK